MLRKLSILLVFVVIGCVAPSSQTDFEGVVREVALKTYSVPAGALTLPREQVRQSFEIQGFVEPNVKSCVSVRSAYLLGGRRVDQFDFFIFWIREDTTVQDVANVDFVGGLLSLGDKGSIQVVDRC